MGPAPGARGTDGVGGKALLATRRGDGGEAAVAPAQDERVAQTAGSGGGVTTGSFRSSGVQFGESVLTARCRPWSVPRPFGDSVKQPMT
ncbi:hypothetical protein GCM10010358_22060 [Streptomyces minutiscleroticus]|uniref:Uncharacterized protein n=1 Tax=Streptomyces minutiscleroticus TaxID=68238 RepID=A0A918KKF8_9ACTN|nr:hypothetical protein GCM10010358_22060 [Streptomyces minutiscleroticus]